MTKEYSIAEARQDFAAIVKELGDQPVVQITRRGKIVAVLLSIREYQRLSSERVGFWRAFSAFRENTNLTEFAIEPSVFSDLRDRGDGRQVDL
jgi:prevent-host-death family protein